MVDAVFARFGEDATWTGIPTPVRVIPREQDDDDRFAQASAIATARFVRVRRSEVAAPATGDEIQLATGELYKIIADPMLDRRHVWRCEVREIISP